MGNAVTSYEVSPKHETFYIIRSSQGARMKVMIKSWPVALVMRCRVRVDGLSLTKVEKVARQPEGHVC